MSTLVTNKSIPIPPPPPPPPIAGFIRERSTRPHLSRASSNPSPQAHQHSYRYYTPSPQQRPLTPTKQSDIAPPPPPMVLLSLEADLATQKPTNNREKSQKSKMSNSNSNQTQNHKANVRDLHSAALTKSKTVSHSNNEFFSPNSLSFPHYDYNQNYHENYYHKSTLYEQPQANVSKSISNDKEAKKSSDSATKISADKTKKKKVDDEVPLDMSDVLSPDQVEMSPLPPPPPLLDDDDEEINSNGDKFDLDRCDELVDDVAVCKVTNNTNENTFHSFEKQYSSSRKREQQQQQHQHQQHQQHQQQQQQHQQQHQQQYDPQQSNTIKRSEKQKDNSKKDRNSSDTKLKSVGKEERTKEPEVTKQLKTSSEIKQVKEVNFTENRFNSRNNDLRRRPVNGIALTLQHKLDGKHLKSNHSGTKRGDHNFDENESSHLKLITHKETKKTREQVKFLKYALRREVLFDGLEKEMFRDIIKCMYQIHCKPDDIVIRQGEYGDAYFVVQSGKLDVIHQENSNSPPKIVGERCAGDAFGEGSLLYSIPRAATLKAVTDALIWALDAVKFVEIRQRLSKEKNEKMARMVNFLKGIELFKNFDEHDIGQIAQAIKARNYTKGEMIVREGEESKEFFVIRKGTAEVHKMDENSGDVHLLEDRLKEGDFFGERGILLNTKRAATIVAASSTRCYVINASDFKNLLEVPLQEKLDAQMNKYNELNSQISKKSLLAVQQAQLENSMDTKNSFTNRVRCTLDELENIGILGVGSFGRVSLVRDPHTNKTYSLKKIRKNQVVETGQEEHIRNERDVLVGLDCIFCCKLYATYQDSLNVYFLMEAVLGGELFTVLRWNKRFSEKTARFYAACVVLAFEHLHSKNVIYRDLKPENLLIAENGYCKLVDFGFAKTRNHSSTLCGTPEYLAPEVIQSAPQGFGVDWWEFGVFIFEMVIGHAPFQDDPHKKMYEKILVDDPEFPPQRKVTERLDDLVRKLLQKDVFKRLGAGINGAVQVKKHPWFSGLDWDAMSEQKLKPPYKPRITANTDLSNFETYPDEDIVEELFDDPEGTRYKWCEGF